MKLALFCIAVIALAGIWLPYTRCDDERIRHKQDALFACINNPAYSYDLLSQCIEDWEGQ